MLRRAKSEQQIVHAYQRMTETMGALAQFTVTTFTASAALRFRSLRSVKFRGGTMDLRIACTALETGAILVTRNTSDFENIPGLQLEDWSRP